MKQLNMKGKCTFTQFEIDRLFQLITIRAKASSNEQKLIRKEMRNLGFYGRDDWNITNCTAENLMRLIKEDLITIKEDIVPSKKTPAETHNAPVKNKRTKVKDIIKIEFNTIENLRAVGFEGFIPVAQLKEDNTVIPQERGVYMVVYTGNGRPKFLVQGTGGFFNGKNPNVPIAELESNWIENTCVIYIGKAGTTIRKRLNQYLKFGNSQRGGHWGGRYIWQIKESDKLLFCWKPTPDKEPGIVETSLINQFKEQYGGRRPFANLRD